LPEEATSTHDRVCRPVADAPVSAEPAGDRLPNTACRTRGVRQPSKECAVQTRKFLTQPVPKRVTLILIVTFPILGLLIGFLGVYGGGASTIEVDSAVTPKAIGLSAGQSRSFTIVVRNPEDEGVRVASISASRSEAVEGVCPAGVLTSAEVNEPTGFIRAGDVNGFAITVSLADNVDDRCLDQAINLPLKVKLQTN